MIFFATALSLGLASMGYAEESFGSVVLHSDRSSGTYISPVLQTSGFVSKGEHLLPGSTAYICVESDSLLCRQIKLAVRAEATVEGPEYPERWVSGPIGDRQEAGRVRYFFRTGDSLGQLMG